MTPSDTDLPREAEHDRELRILLRVTRSLPPRRISREIGRFFLRYYIRKSRTPVVASVLGFRMVIDPHQYFEAALLFFPQCFDVYEIQAMCQVLSEGDTFVDAGCFVGFYSLIAAKKVGNSGKVVAIEANKSIYDKLEYHVAANQLTQILPCHVGISDRVETLSFGINKENVAASSFRIGGGESISVSCMPLLDILNKNHVTSIKLMKLDIEGFEIKVMKKFFDDAPESLYPKHVLVEANWKYQRDDGNSVASFFVGMGYRLVRNFGRNVFLSRS